MNLHWLLLVLHLNNMLFLAKEILLQEEDKVLIDFIVDNVKENT